MFPAILLFCCIGIYSINNSPTDVYFTAFFGFVGYALIKFGLEPAPMLLGFVLGKLMEEKLRQALVLSRGSFMTFVERPVAARLLLLRAGRAGDRPPADRATSAGGGFTSERRHFAAAGLDGNSGRAHIRSGPPGLDKKSAPPRRRNTGRKHERLLAALAAMLAFAADPPAPRSIRSGRSP